MVRLYRRSHQTCTPIQTAQSPTDNLGRKRKYFATAEKIARGHELVRDFLLSLNTPVVRVQSSNDGDRTLDNTCSLSASCN